MYVCTWSRERQAWHQPGRAIYSFLSIYIYLYPLHPSTPAISIHTNVICTCVSRR